MQFNCFLLMPIMDKLPALLREETETELRRRIKEKFRVMNEKLNSREFAQNLNPPSLQ
ncbi:unnamed protein product [Brassica rapa subsp. trilocularis]